MQTMEPYRVRKTDFFNIRVAFQISYLQNEVGDPPIFFTFLTKVTHNLAAAKVL